MTHALPAIMVVSLLFACRNVTIPSPAQPLVQDIRQELPNGWVEIPLRRRYPGGASDRLLRADPCDTGDDPHARRVSSSGLEGEVLIRKLDQPVENVAAGETASSVVRWDGRDEHGMAVPAGTYVLLLDFAYDTPNLQGQTTRGVTFELSAEE